MRQIVVCVVLATGFLQVSPLAAPQVAGTAPLPAVVGQPAVTIGQTVIGGTVQSGQATINGTVLTPGGQPLADTTVRARDLLTGRVGGSTRTATAGEFSINVPPGSYVLEIVDDSGQIIGTSSFISATAGSIVTAATVTIASGALSAVTAATGLVATLGATAAKGVGFAAAAAGVAGVVAPPGTAVASPSR